MIIEIKNFGPIDYLKLDLDKDLHLLYGKNNVGKSYALNLVYLILKNLEPIKNDKNLKQEFEIYYLKYKEIIENEIFKKLSKELNISDIDIKIFIYSLNQNHILPQEFLIDITYVLDNIISNYFNPLFERYFNKSLINTFSNINFLSNKINNENFEVKIQNSNLILYINYKNSDLVEYKIINLDNEKYFVNIQRNLSFEFRNTNLVLFEERNIVDFFVKLADYTKELILDFLKNFTYNSIILPASRSGLYQSLNSFGSLFAEFSTDRRNYGIRNFNLPNFSEPVSDYYLNLSSLNTNLVNEKFIKILNDFEKEVFKGSLNYNEDSKKIYYKDEKLDFEIEINSTSTMVSELSPLLMLLKYKTNKSENDKSKYFLFIEEPEAHIHPEIQIKLLEFFFKLINSDVKILITTHSDIFLNKLNNSILNKEIDIDKIAVYHLISDKNGTIQNPNMIVTENGVDDDNFLEVTEKLFNERLEIFDALND